MANTGKSDFLGTDPLFPLLIKLSIPAALSMMVNALYNVVDTIFVGQGVGPLAIAALGVVFPIQLIIGSLSQAIGIGSASIISRRLGEKKPEEASGMSGTAMTTVLIVALSITTAILFFSEPLLTLVGATEAIRPMAKDYLSIIAVGMIFMSFSMTMNGLIRAEGNAQTAAKGLIIGAFLNILLDPVFIFGLNMGIRGAATATAVSQFISFCYLASYYLRGKSYLSIKPSHFIIHPSLLAEAVILGIPNFIRMGGVSLLILIVNNLLGSYGGDLAISTYGMINRLFTLILMPLLGIVQGFQPIAGYNFGAMKYERVKDVLKYAVLTATVVAVFFFALMFFFPKIFILMFTHNQELIKSSAEAFKIYVLAFPFLGFQFIGAAYFQAVGKKIPSLILNLSLQFIFLIPIVLTLPRFFGITGIWISFPIADFLAFIVTVTALIFELSHLTQKHQEQQNSDSVNQEILQDSALVEMDEEKIMQ